MIGQKLFSKPEVAEILHCSISLIDHLTAAKQLGHLRLGHRCFYLESDIEAYLATRRVEPSAVGKSDTSKAAVPAATRGQRARASAGTL
jgi:hypothetical protein